MMNLSYKLFGVRATNVIINNTVGDVLTSGETIESLLKDIEHHRQKNVGALSGFTVEALEVIDEERIENILQVMIDTIRA